MRTAALIFVLSAGTALAGSDDDLAKAREACEIHHYHTYAPGYEKCPEIEAAYQRSGIPEREAGRVKALVDEQEKRHRDSVTKGTK